MNILGVVLACFLKIPWDMMSIGSEGSEVWYCEFLVGSRSLVKHFKISRRVHIVIMKLLVVLMKSKWRPCINRRSSALSI